MPVHAQSLQSCPTPCDPMDCSLPGSSVHGILRARILEWVAMPSSRGSSRPKDRTCISCTPGRFFTTEPTWNTPPSPQPIYMSPSKFPISIRMRCAVLCCRFSRLCATPWTVAHQAPLSTGFSRQEYWSGLIYPSASIRIPHWIRDPPYSSVPSS